MCGGSGAKQDKKTQGGGGSTCVCVWWRDHIDNAKEHCAIIGKYHDPLLKGKGLIPFLIYLSMTSTNEQQLQNTLKKW